VNFMTNPDELAAAEQFGTGDKAFAVATLLATMPGLPMLGHGQVEGFRERYGMEFRTARWEEPIDQGHGEHFERTIVPLLRRRAEFAGIDRFHLYDAVAGDGAVVDDVYAYSNGPAGQPNLVLVHNRYAEVDVRIDRSVRYRKPGHGSRGRLTTTRLIDDLELRWGGPQRVRFVDHRSGWQVETTVDELRTHGLGVHLGPYEARVLAIEPVVEPPVAVAPAEAAPPTTLGPGSARRRAAKATGSGRSAPAKRRARTAPRPATQPPKSTRRRSGTGNPP
jgi:hypothetical protein